MKFPSLNYIGTEAINSFERFFLPLLFAITGTYCAIFITESNNEDCEVLMRVLHTCMLGLPFSLGCMLYLERSNKANLRILLPIWVLILMIAYGIFLAPNRYFSDFRLSLIFFVLAVVMHLWVAIAPYIHKDEKQGFWHFNEILFTRIVMAAIFSGALYLGLSMALVACKMLLKIDIDSKRFLELWFIIAGIFNTWFFLAGIPKDYEELNTEKIFPKGLKVFTQYVLIPLVSIYMLILYAYGIKIVFLWNLPTGWVAMPVMWYAAVGVLAVLLVYPLRDDEENTWVRFFARFFFRATLPIIVLLYVAIWARVRAYGITEDRYYLILLGAWLTGISFYYIFSKQKNIRYIPLSLAIIGALSWFGPWGAFAVSESSQLSRLETVLEKNNIWKPGANLSPSITWNGFVEAQVNNIIRYFVDRDEVMGLEPIYGKDVLQKLIHEEKTRTKISDSYSGRFEKTELENGLIALLHKNSAGANNNSTANQDVKKYPELKSFTAVSYAYGFDIKGYSKMYHFYYYHDQSPKPFYLSDKDTLEVLRDDSNKICLIFKSHGKIIERADFSSIVKNLDTKTKFMDIPHKEMTLDCTGPINMKIVAASIKYMKPIDTAERDVLFDLEAFILVK